ncbi:hypothetical protein AMS68_007623 [Peltaster fructicola]|uniref:Apple domain-containing protein n=1 Tax=Peltaster fructicola TaxID=286661 RepID=A0A6H0Y567_9PEZI|nr:hypothetical protein AMS68_007623 [Peltaster fructicola]
MLLYLILAGCALAKAETYGRPGHHHSSDLSSVTSRISTPANSNTGYSSTITASSASSTTPLKQSVIVVTITASPVYISGCPPITPVTTISYDSGTFVYNVPTATVTRTITTYYFGEVVIPTAATETQFGGSYHTEYTSTDTVTTISVVPAATTITIPTPAGFTPVLCDAAYYRTEKRSTTDYTEITQGYISSETVWTTNPSTKYTTTWINTTSTSTVYFYTGDYTFYTQLQVTVTSTRNEPTSTVFEACASNNISPNSPFQRSPDYTLYVNQVAPVYDSAGNAESYVFDTISVDAVDCCALCQKDPACVGSSYNVVLTDRHICSLSLKTDYANKTCGVGYPGAAAIYQRTDALIALSNSPCGQWQFPY